MHEQAKKLPLRERLRENKLYSIVMNNKTASIAAVFLAVIVLAGLFAPLVAPHDPYAADVLNKLQGSSLTYPMGTDNLGRCIFSRILYGVRTSLGIAVAIGVISVFIGMLVGSISGYVGGRLDSFIMRICDAMLAYPSMILVLIVVAVLGIGLKNIFIAMLVVHWIWYARIARGMTLSIKSHAYITAARISGSSTARIIAKHLIPGMVPQMVPLFTVDLAGIVLQLAGFSFLGVGTQPPTAEWGAMINEGRAVMRQNAMVIGWPSIVLILVVLAMNIVGEQLRRRMEGEGR